MNAISGLVLSEEFLTPFLNVAVAAFLACGIALVISRWARKSLPLRHALLVAGLAGSVAGPVIVPLLDLPAFWALAPQKKPEPVPTEAESNPILLGRQGALGQPEMQIINPSIGDLGSQPVKARMFPREVEPLSASGVLVEESVSRPPISPSDPWTLGEVVRLVGTMLWVVWAVGTAVALKRAIICVVRLREWLKTVSIANSPQLATAVQCAADCIGLRRSVIVCQTSFLQTPVTLGLIQPRIVLPTGIEEALPPDQLRAVLQHEMAHISRFDLWIGLLQQVAYIMHWWNPLVKMTNRQIADAREQICDDLALRELAEPNGYAATLIYFAERCSSFIPVPGTLGFGSSPAGQLEKRIRHILSSPVSRCVRLSLRSSAGVSAATVLMSATLLMAQVRVKPIEGAPAQEKPKAGATEKPVNKSAPTAAGAQDPTLHELMQQMAMYEKAYFPFEVKVMETFRFPDDLTPQERVKNPLADGRKHQRLMEYAQLAKRIWRSKETDLVDDEIKQGPYERFSDAERIIQRGPSSLNIDGVAATEYYINNRNTHIEHYLSASPLLGVFCLSQYSASELFSEAFKDNEEAIELAWDNGDAKLSFSFGKPHFNTKYILWLSRAHAWHPIRCQRYWDAKDKLWFDEWEVTKFVPHRKLWRVAEGTHRYRELKGRTVVDQKIKYSIDFKVLTEKYGSDVGEKQFIIEIPAGAKIRGENKPDAEPAPLGKTREITVRVIDVAGMPIPNATVRLPASQLRDYDVVASDVQGIAKSFKAPVDNVTVRISADGFRPFTAIIGDVNELRAIMTPQTKGVVVLQGKPVADAWITNGSLQIRPDGYAYVPNRDWDGRDDDWSRADGKFDLKSNLTLRRIDAVVPLIAVDPNRDKMAIRFVKAGELGQQQELALQTTCKVTGHFLLKDMSESVEVGIALTTSADQYIGFLSTRRELTKEGLRVDFQLRLPPGDYLLKSSQTSHHSGFTIPVTIPSGRAELDLGTKSVSLSGSALLKGKPAPELRFQWRPGQEKSWEELRGKIVVLDFWGTWCRPCVAGMPDLMDVAEQFRDKPITWLSVHTPNLKSFDELDRKLAVCQEKSWNKRTLPFTTVLDRPVDDSEYSGQTSRLYSVAEWPTLIVVDQQGKVIGPVQKNKLAETIGRLLNSRTEK